MSDESPDAGTRPAAPAGPAAPDGLVAPVTRWFRAHGRDLPWRSPDCTPWGVLVSEVMLQQTPVARVEPVWRAWLARWPGPAELAAANPADVLSLWSGLGYPRRALRLRDCARELVARHGGRVPADEATLRALPGIGEYTAAAVRAFAHRRRSVVLDTNVRRVLARALGGEALPPPSLTRAERARAAALVPADDEAAARWSAAVMELGALVCTARSPACGSCPVAGACAWRAAGFPADAHAHRRRTQAWAGTDRQARGAVLRALRAAHDAGDPWVPEAALLDLAAGVVADRARAEAVLAGLLADGLARRGTGSRGGALSLPGGAGADD